MGGQHGLAILVYQALNGKQSPQEAGRQKHSNSEMGRDAIEDQLPSVLSTFFVFLLICSNSAQPPCCQHACHILLMSFLIHATYPWGASMKLTDDHHEGECLTAHYTEGLVAGTLRLET